MAITGTNQDDTLVSTGVGDIMVGLSGDDIYIVDDALDRVVENPGQGTDVVESTVSFDLSTMANVETLLLLGAGNINGIGNASDNLIVGTGGDNTLDGGAGNDQMAGGTGNDTYFVDSLLDLVVENPGQGIDTISTNLNYDLSAISADIENLILTGAATTGTGSTGDNVITGNGNVNSLDGGDGNDTLDGGAGADSMIGGLGDDVFLVDNAGDLVFENATEGNDTVFSTVTYTLSPTEEIENLTLTGLGTIDGTGNGLDNIITGNDQTNVLDGGVGNDTLDGGIGDDTMIGGLGDDTFYVDTPLDVVSENGGQGTDTIFSTASFNLALNATNVENLTLLGSAVTGVGDGGINVITGNSSANSLDGGAGDDTLIGMTGNDTYAVDSSLDVVIENTGEGTDLIRSSVDFDLSTSGQNVENLQLLGAAIVGIGDDGTNNYILGNANANTLDGGDGNDTLDGGTGADSMIGGDGNDTFYVDNAADSVFEVVGEGNDWVITTVTYTLTALQEIDVLMLDPLGSPINGTGNVFANTIFGNDAVNTIDGGGGDDVLDGGLSDDTMIGGLGNDTFVVDSSSDVLLENLGEGVDEAQSTVNFDLSLNGVNVDNLTLFGTAVIGTGNSIDNLIFGNNSVNTLSGGGGNDTLDGGAGSDTMIGGLGDDTFYVGSAGDVVLESAGQGTDTVFSAVNYTFSSAPNLENLTLTGTAQVGTGNGSDNIIIGNASNNVLTGADGNDTLSGFAGIDSLNGGLGNDSLDGGLGGDVMVGGSGNDTFTVDDVGDVVSETTSGSLGGTDTVLSSISFTLAANFENLTLDAAAGNINGTGNSVVNIITGNVGDNTLNGAAGADTMFGGGGNDTFFVDNLLDTAVGGAGTDTIISSLSYTLNTVPLANIENLTLTGSAATGTGNANNNIIIGDAATNILTGLDGNDTLDGGAGTDSLIGGLGDDTFVVNSTTDIIVELAGLGQGTADTALSSVTYTLTAANVENVTLSGSANINATGSAGDNIITGNSGNNVLNGGLGFDSLEGGLGNDTFVVDTLTDIITDAGGNDTISEGFVDFDLNTVTGVIENLILTGIGNLNGTGDANNNIITGNAGINTLTGNDGNDTLNGGAGADTMIGGLGDDTFYVDSLLDVIIENPGEGTDTVVLIGNLGTYVIPPNVEGLSIIAGSGGNLVGSAGNDILTGNAGNNSLNGLAGADTMIGGKGNDIYFADDPGDFIIENPGEGTDKVFVASSLTFTSFDMSTSAVNVENLTVTGTGTFDVLGNSDDNILVGNSGSNILNGGFGADTMIGGLGDDFFGVNTTGDVVSDSGGIDTVFADISYTLKSGFENLFLLDATIPSPTATGDLIGTGNGANNIIDATLATGDHTLLGLSGSDTLFSGGGSDTLNGGSGADTMAGGDGDDDYIVDNGGDLIIENTDEGDDTLTVAISYTLSSTAEIETINLTGSGGQKFTASDTDNEITANASTKVIFAMGGDDTITGGASADIINGGDGDDYIVAGGGQDTMTGGAGQDTFVLEFATAFLNADVIKDFNTNDVGSLGDPVLGDVLDISDIMDHITGSGTLTDYVRIVDYYTDSLVQIDLDGTGNTNHFHTIATLKAITGLTGETGLLLSGNLEDGGVFT